MISLAHHWKLSIRGGFSVILQPQLKAPSAIPVVYFQTKSDIEQLRQSSFIPRHIEAYRFECRSPRGETQLKVPLVDHLLIRHQCPFQQKDRLRIPHAEGREVLDQFRQFE